MKALISLSNKEGIIEFAKELIKLNIEIISTGGTAKVLRDNNIKVTDVSEITGFPECLDGRVKTLHPKIHGGILAVRDNKNHMEEISRLDIETIDLVIVNLYPFKETISKDDFTMEEAIENIDIGGPTMLRSAAKNYKDVGVIIDPLDYKKVIEQLKEKGSLDLDTRLYLATKVFQYTAYYDGLIANYLKLESNSEMFPNYLSFSYEKIQDLRYGENPHQKAAFYEEISKDKGNLTNALQLHGKALSFNNINDANGALELLKEYEKPTVVACKHSNPCGVGTGKNIYEGFMKAYEADPVSIFGGIVAANREIGEKTAQKINEIFIEIVIAPSFTDKAVEILKEKKNIRLLILENIVEKSKDSYDLKKVGGGILVQEKDNILFNEIKYEVVTKRKPSENEIENLLFSWKIVKHSKSNAIVIGQDNQSLGIGVGQVSRIWALEQAVEHCKQHIGKEALKGAVLASDAFFPFEDSIEAAEKAGIKAIIQPGGSIRDEKVIKACDERNISMLFAKMRHFKH